MPTRAQTIIDATTIFESAEYPTGLTSSTAWLGIYQTLLWYEPVNWVGFIELPHIIDSDKLRTASPQQQRTWVKPKPWQARAQAISEYIALKLECPVTSVPDKVDLLMKRPEYFGMQRHNSLGIAFAGLVTHILNRFGSPGLSYATEVPAPTVFPNASFLGRTSATRIDALVSVSGIPRVAISAKWSLRHDRLKDVINECEVYERAFQQTYPQLGSSGILTYLITNEYHPARLKELLATPCLAGVVHVHKAAVVDVCGLNGRLAQMMDLTNLINATASW